MPSRYGSKRSTYVPFWNCSQFPGQRKSHQGDRQQFKHSVLGNSQHVGASFGHFQPHHTQVKYKREPTAESQTCLTKRFKQMQYRQTLSNDSSANKQTKGGEKQNKTVCMFKTLNGHFFQCIS